MPTLLPHAMNLFEDGVVPGYLANSDLPAALGQITRKGRMRLLENLKQRVADLEWRLASDAHPHVQTWASQSVLKTRERLAIVEASLNA